MQSQHPVQTRRFNTVKIRAPMKRLMRGSKPIPTSFKFFDELPHERAVRKLVLNEVQKYERMQKMNAGIMQKLDGDPEAKQAYETLLKRVPEADRERATASIAKHVFALGTPRNDRAKTQSAGGGMRVGG